MQMNKKIDPKPKGYRPWWNDPMRLMRAGGQLPGIEDGAIVDTPLAPNDSENSAKLPGKTPNEPESYALGGAIPEEGDNDQDASGGNDNDQDDNTSQLTSALKTVNDALMFGRSQFGIGGKQQAGNIPARPAGPGGDQPDTNPFSTKTTKPPFGRRPLRIGAIDESSNAQQSFADGGPVDEELPEQGEEAPQQGAIPEDTYNTGTETTNDVNRNKTRLQIRMLQQGQGETDEGVEATNAPPGSKEPEREQGPIEKAGAAPHQLLQKGFQRLIGYVSGSGAASPQEVQSAEGQVDPQGMLDEDTRKLLAVDAANKDGGPAAAFKMVQHYRTKYDAYKNFAAAALAGSPGKPADIAAAARAATQAYPNMLDGAKVQFQPSENGVTATVTTGGKSQQIPLTVEQFNEFLRGNAGQYDNVIENGGAKTLMQVAQGQGRPVQLAQPKQAQAPQGQPQPQGPGPLERPNMRRQPVPITQQSGWQPFAQQRPNAPAPAAAKRPSPQEQDDKDIDPQLTRQANRLFPWASQNEQRTKYIMDQMNARAERGSKLEVAKQQGINTRDVAMLRSGATVKAAEARAGAVTGAAQIRADAYKDATNVREAGRTEVARTHLQGVLAGVAQSAQNSQQRSAAVLASKYVANVPLGQDIPPDVAKMISQLMGGSGTAPQAQAPNAPQAAQPKAQQPAPQGQKWYTNPKTGERRLGPA